MYFLKVILAVWTAVFLALPSCPCQFFGALGMSFEHRHMEAAHAENSQYLGGVDELCAPQSDSGENLPICHCDEALAKTAEESEGEMLALNHSGGWVYLGFQRISVQLWQNGAISHGGNYPVGTGGHLVLSRSMTGVYRI